MVAEGGRVVLKGGLGGMGESGRKGGGLMS